MNAEEARSLVKPRESLDLIYDMIKEACAKGKYTVEVDHVSHEDVTILKEDGYHVFCDWDRGGNTNPPLTVGWWKDD